MSFPIILPCRVINRVVDIVKLFMAFFSVAVYHGDMLLQNFCRHVVGKGVGGAGDGEGLADVDHGRVICVRLHRGRTTVVVWRSKTIGDYLLEWDFEGEGDDFEEELVGDALLSWRLGGWLICHIFRV